MKENGEGYCMAGGDEGEENIAVTFTGSWLSPFVLQLGTPHASIMKERFAEGERISVHIASDMLYQIAPQWYQTSHSDVTQWRHHTE